MKGFAALISVIIIGAVMVAAGMMVTLTSINEGQISLSGYNKTSATTLLDSCVEESLLFINQLNSLPSNIATPLGNCSTSINSQVGSSWDFNIGTTLSGYQHSNRLKINRSTTINVGSWQEQ